MPIITSLWQLPKQAYSFLNGSVGIPVDQKEASTVVTETSSQLVSTSEQPQKKDSSCSSSTPAKKASSGTKSLNLSGIPIKEGRSQKKLDVAPVPVNLSKTPKTTRTRPRGFGKATGDGIRVSTPKEFDDGIRVTASNQASAPMDDGIRVSAFNKKATFAKTDGTDRPAVRERSEDNSTLLGSRHATTKRPVQSTSHSEISHSSFLDSNQPEQKDPLLVSGKQPPINRKSSLFEGAVTVSTGSPKESTPYCFETDRAFEGPELQKNDEPMCHDPCRCCRSNFMFPVEVPVVVPGATGATVSPPVQESKASEPVPASVIPVVPKPPSTPIINHDKPRVSPAGSKPSAAKKRNINDDLFENFEKPATKKIRAAPLEEITLNTPPAPSREQPLVGRKRRLARSSQKMVPRGHFSIHKLEEELTHKFNLGLQPCIPTS